MTMNFATDSNALSRQYFDPTKVIKDLDRTDISGAKVTFVNMPIREQAKPNNAPLGPALLAARLREFDADVGIVDLNAYRFHDEISERRGLPNRRALTFNEMEELLSRYFEKHGDQDLIALSGLITTLEWQEEVAKVLRRIQPLAVIASGGGLATEFRETLFKWIPSLDAVAHSEGDDVILKMAFDAKQIRNRGMKSAVASGSLAPYFLGMNNNRPRFLYDGGRPASLDELPFPAWDLLESDINGFNVLEMYIGNPVWGGVAQNSSATPFSMNRSMNTVSSRGCPFECKFCFRGAQGERNYGTRSAANLASEMQSLVERYKVDFVGIEDDNFMVNPKRIAELVPLMKEITSGLPLSWGTHGRLDEAADLRPSSKQLNYSISRKRLRVDDMAEAGCTYIGFGAESASERVLDAMGKGGFILKNGTTKYDGYSFPTTMTQGIENTYNAGMHGNCTWIMGYPGEKLFDLQTTVEFIRWQEELYTSGKASGSREYEEARNSVNKAIFVATAYPGTELFRTQSVKRKLTERLNIKFNSAGHPIPDGNLFKYVRSLNDATDIIVNETSEPLNYSDIPDDTFLEARDLIMNDNLYGILDL